MLQSFPLGIVHYCGSIFTKETKFKIKFALLKSGENSELVRVYYFWKENLRRT